MDQANTIATALCGVALGVGVLGTVIPVLPGSLLIVAAVAIWALVVQNVAGWIVLAVVVALVATGNVLNYFIVGKRMTAAGVPRRSIVIAGLLGIVGFFVIPLLGLPVGFVAGMYLAEFLRLRPGGAGARGAWDSAWHATKAVGLGMMIEALTALLSAVAWLTSVVAFDAAA